MIENGYIYEKTVPQDYCESCRSFLSDREILGICPICGGKSTADQCEKCSTSLDSSEVKDKHCKKCGYKTVMKDNKHLYFELTKFKDKLQDLIDNNANNWRKNALGEAQKYIDMGLVDRATTRQLNWGIEVPVEGYDDKRIYVWIEAVLGYLSVGQEVANSRNINFDDFMSNNNKNLLSYYVHGKDNIPFHTTIFPALIEGLKNNYRLPDYIISSAYVNLDDEKMSKSKGNLITVNELLEKFDMDTIRFYFTLNGPEVKDINCSIDEIIQCHNKFLVEMLGNFVNRNLSYINKKFDGKITEGKIDSSVVEFTQKTYELVGKYIEKGEFKNATNSLLEYISFANKYYDEKQPWIKVKENIREFNDITYTCTYMISNMANLVNPILPKTSKKIKKMLNLKDYQWKEEKIKGAIHIENINLLFNKIEEKSKILKLQEQNK